MTEVKARVEPFACGEVLTSERAEAVLVAAAQRLMLGKCVTVAGGFESAVGRWLTRLSGEVGPSGFDISDEMLGGLALANVVLRARHGDPAYLAGREDAALAIEKTAERMYPSPGLACAAAVMTASRAAKIARGLQPQEDATT